MTRMKRHHLKRFSSSIINNTRRLHPRAEEIIREYAARARTVDTIWDKLFGLTGFGGLPRAEVIKKLETVTTDPQRHFALVNAKYTKRFAFYNTTRPIIYRIVEARLNEGRIYISKAYKSREIVKAAHLANIIQWVQRFDVPEEVLCEAKIEDLPSLGTAERDPVK